MATSDFFGASTHLFFATYAEFRIANIAIRKLLLSSIHSTTARGGYGIGRAVLLLVLALCLISSGFGVQRLGLVMVPVGAAVGALLGGTCPLVAKSQDAGLFPAAQHAAGDFHLTFTGGGSAMPTTPEPISEMGSFALVERGQAIPLSLRERGKCANDTEKSTLPDEEQLVRSCVSALPKSRSINPRKFPSLAMAEAVGAFESRQPSCDAAASRRRSPPGHSPCVQPAHPESSARPRSRPSPLPVITVFMQISL